MNREVLRRAAMVMDNPTDYLWTVQGFGMVRTYLDDDKRYRLNVWDDRLRVADVSDVHDHPWDFTSLILIGQLNNMRYEETEPRHPVKLSSPFWHTTIKTGEGGGKLSPIDRRWLTTKGREIYTPGMSYYQPKDEIHATSYSPGTVTLNDRSLPTPEYTANVYWLGEPVWVDAEPRPATKAEVYSAVEQARYQARMERSIFAGVRP